MTTQPRQKRYTVYKYPSLHGTPRHFSTRAAATLYAFWVALSLGHMCELHDWKKGTYTAYWI